MYRAFRIKLCSRIIWCIIAPIVIEQNWCSASIVIPELCESKTCVNLCCPRGTFVTKKRAGINCSENVDEKYYAEPPQNEELEIYKEKDIFYISYVENCNPDPKYLKGWISIAKVKTKTKIKKKLFVG